MKPWGLHLVGYPQHPGTSRSLGRLEQAQRPIALLIDVNKGGIWQDLTTVGDRVDHFAHDRVDWNRSGTMVRRKR